MVTSMLPTVEQFVSLCRSDSKDAYEQFKSLLTLLDDENTRIDARQFLGKLKHIAHEPDEDHFQFLTQQVLDENDNPRELTLLQFPSTFEPEAWSFTFYEGLIRYPAAQYRDLRLIELGTGIGWISIALALRYLPEKIYGLDINPKAVTCARINLYLTALGDEGEIVAVGDNQCLLDLVDFAQSDLCGHFAQKRDYFDRIIGCIPQVLNPEPEVMETQVAESASDEYLQSLSNYAAQQGYIEDQFGLGLIAKAVEQTIGLLKSNGKLILNLGGRPGRSVLEKLMQRRGFKVRRVWQTQVEQATDTDIDALVAIEKSTGHRFEFYMSSNADDPIDARAAQAFQLAGGTIFHSVDVYEAKLCFADHAKALYRELEGIGSERLSSAVDLTFNQRDHAEERFSFLSYLVKWLHHQTAFPYGDIRGFPRFRQQVVEYLRFYHHVIYDDSQVMITPGRSELLNNLFCAYQPHLTLIDKQLRHLLDDDLDKRTCEVIEAPSSIEYLMILIEKLQPGLLITQLNSDEIHSAQLVQSLVACAVKANVILVIDLSQMLDLSSTPKSHGVYRFLAETPHPGNLILMSALLHNRVYEHYSVNITLLTNPKIQRDLVDAAALTYCRTSIMTQVYYAHLLEELLYFQRTRTHQRTGCQKWQDSLPLKLSSVAQAAFGDPVVTGRHILDETQTLRLDYGENDMKAPQLLKDLVLESYLMRRFNPADKSAEKFLRQFLQSRFGLPQSIYAKMAFFDGVAPLFNGLLTLCAQTGQRLILPNSCHGYFSTAATFRGVDVMSLITDETDDFKVTADKLNAMLAENSGSWVFLDGPVANPTGAVYSQQQLVALLEVALRHNATVILDTIYTGLEFEQSQRWVLHDVMEAYAHADEAKFILISDLSGEYAAGGLRFGYAWSTSQELMVQLRNIVPHEPHFTVCYAVRALFEAHGQSEPSLLAHMDEQRALLAERAAQLAELLTGKGWRVLPPRAGLFLLAKPQKFIDEQGLSDKEGADKVAEQLLEQENLAINGATWTGLPGYCRFVLSVEQADFDEALQRLQRCL